MRLKFSICHKCKTFNHKELVKKLIASYPDAKFDVKCQSYCGPGSKRPFVAVNEVFIEADSLDELLEKVKNEVEGKSVN